jgi:hypothetical protein
MIVTVTAEDIHAAATETASQLIRKIHFGRDSDHGGKSKRQFWARFGHGVIGMLGQIVVSRALKLPITSTGVKVDDGDVAYQIEVRTTEWPDGHLLIYEKDKDNSPVFHVTCKMPNFTIHAPVIAKHGKKRKWWRERADPPCWWIPPSALHSIGDVVEFHEWMRRRQSEGIVFPQVEPTTLDEE